jgi:hypothetical protein
MGLRMLAFTLVFLASSLCTFAQSDPDDSRTPSCIRIRKPRDFPVPTYHVCRHRFPDDFFPIARFAAKRKGHLHQRLEEES